jgi:hypothetical protein
MITIDPDNYETNLKVGSALLYLINPEEAITYFEKSYAMNSQRM